MFVLVCWDDGGGRIAASAFAAVAGSGSSGSKACLYVYG
jgi:hypothetical protein